MLHRLYMRTLALAASPRAGWWLFGIAFAEASFFPIPPDALLIPMALARPDRAWRLRRDLPGGQRRWAARWATSSATRCSISSPGR